MKKYCFFFLIFTWFQLAIAQEDGEIEAPTPRKPITVMLFDMEGKGIENAEILLTQPDSVYAKGITSLAGQLIFENIPTGDYDVVILLESGRKILFNNQWIETREANDRIYRIPREEKGKKKSKEKEGDKKK